MKVLSSTTERIRAHREISGIEGALIRRNRPTWLLNRMANALTCVVRAVSSSVGRLLWSKVWLSKSSHMSWLICKLLDDCLLR
jgi:hypothetical protein